MKNKLNNRGIALITVILIVGILVAVVIELNRSSRADIYDAANLSDGIKLTYIAKSGFYGAAALLTNSNNNYVTLRDNWAHAEMLSAQSQTLFTDGYFIATVEDEAGKIPLNKLINDTPDNPVKNILVRLLTLQEFGLDPRKAEEIADSIKYWIGGNEDSPGAGAESSYYASLDPPYEAKKAPLDCIEELLMVKGITSEIFYGTKEKPGLAMYVTADSDDGKININTAPKMVLRALAGNITPELADKMDEYRRKDSSDSDLAHPDWYKKVTGESVTMPALITVTSNYFKIISTGSMKNMTQSVSGVVKRSGSNTFQIVKWRQD